MYICMYVYVSSFSPATKYMLRITRRKNTMLRITKRRCRLMQPCSETIYSAPWVPCSGLMQSSLLTSEYFEEPSVYMFTEAPSICSAFIVPDDVSLPPCIRPWSQ